MYTVHPEAYRVGEQIDKSPRPLAVMAVGLPGSGKSTLLNEIAWLEGPHVPVVKVNAIRNRFIQLRAGRKLPEFVDQEMYNQIEQSLDNAGIALIDATNIESERRVLDIGRYRDMGAATVGAVFMDIPKELAIQRNNQRLLPTMSNAIDQMEISLRANPPTTMEGFNWVVTIKPDELIVHSDV